MAAPINNIVIYVDSTNGFDTNTGAIDSPFKTLSKALQEIKAGGLIILQTGTYSISPYGNITKNVSIQAAYGSTPTITDKISFINCQGSLQGIKFSTGTVSIDNEGFGGVKIRECDFDGPDYPVKIVSANYVSIHQNRFYDYLEAIRVTTCRELTISSNYFYSDTAINGRAVFISDVEWMDVYQNTIYGAHDTAAISSDINLRIIYIKMNSTIINRKSFSLPSFSVANGYGYDVAINVVNGPTQEYGKDYTVINGGITISWSGLNLEDQISTSDTLRIMYSEGPSPVTGDAISAYNITNSNSRIDSNNINDASVGIYFSDSLRVRYNNFNGTTTHFNGTPTDGGATGSITGAPNYVDPTNGDFNLEADSPDIDYADPERWSQILREMGVGISSGSYIPLSYPTGRPGISPFNRSVDYDGLHRLVRSDRDDIGAYEYPSTGINPESLAYVGESGYDLINPGSITGPFATIDRGFTGVKDLKVETNRLGKLIIKSDGTNVGITGIGGITGNYSYARFMSNNINLDNLKLNIGDGNRNSIAFFHPSYPSNTPTGVYVGLPTNNPTGVTGSRDNPYRHVDEAISEDPTATTIYVKPGIYPSFEGSSGKKLVGISDINYLNLNSSNYNEFDSTGWTGASNVDFNDTYLTFSGDGVAESRFVLDGNIRAKMDLTVVQDTLEIRLENPANYLMVKKSGSILTIRYYTGGSSYTSNLTNSDTQYQVSFVVEGSSAKIKVKSDTLNITKEIDLVSAHTNLWGLKVTYIDSLVLGSTGVVSKLQVAGGSITGVQGITGSSMYRKVFGIAGERGLSGLYSLYGD